jgi:uncharacterized protein
LFLKNQLTSFGHPRLRQAGSPDVLRMTVLAYLTCSQGQSRVQHACTRVQIPTRVPIYDNGNVTANNNSAVGCGLYLEPADRNEEVMKAVLALIVIYVGTFLVAIQGASNTSVEASEQNGAQTGGSIDPLKEKEIRSLLELVGARDAIQDAGNAATEQYRQKVLETSADSDRAQALTNAYKAEFQKRFDADAVTTQLVGIYDKHFTEDEIKDLLEFYGSPLGQKVAEAMPKISREVQMTVRTAGNQAARQAWQEVHAQYTNAGENNTRRFASRRHNANANVQGQAQPAGAQQVQADSQQP